METYARVTGRELCLQEKYLPGMRQAQRLEVLVGGDGIQTWLEEGRKGRNGFSGHGQRLVSKARAACGEDGGPDVLSVCGRLERV